MPWLPAMLLGPPSTLWSFREPLLWRLSGFGRKGTTKRVKKATSAVRKDLHKPSPFQLKRIELLRPWGYRISSRRSTSSQVSTERLMNGLTKIRFESQDKLGMLSLTKGILPCGGPPPLPGMLEDQNRFESAWTWRPLISEEMQSMMASGTIGPPWQNRLGSWL